MSKLDQTVQFQQVYPLQIGLQGPVSEKVRDPMFSKPVEYALRAVVHLAYSVPEGRTTDQIAEATRVAHRAYLSKVLQKLSRAGLVLSHRGVGGGMTLAKPPEAITILEVV